MQAAPEHHYFDASAARLSYFERGAADAPVVLIAHATGFHARVWDKTVAALPDGFRVIALELRGHGRSEGKQPIPSWRAIAQDVRELIEGLDLRSIIGVGHSMGGHCMTQLAHALPDRFRRLVLVDPVISRPDIYDIDKYPGMKGPEEHPIASRRNRFESWHAMFEYFRDREPYSLWRPKILEDYCRYGVLPAADGDGVELACAPVVEASVYFQQRHGNIHDLIPQIETPVTVLRAQRRSEAEWRTTNFQKSPTWEKLADRFPNGRDIYLPHLTHFIPMQEPELVARFIADENAVLAPGDVPTTHDLEAIDR